MNSIKPRYLVIAMLVQTIWGVTPSASRIVLEYLPVEAYAAIRYSVSGLLLLLVTLARHRRLALRRADLPKLAGIGMLAYGVDALGTLYGLKLGGVLNFALASSLNAVITASVAAWLLKERVGPNFYVAAILSIFGGLLLAAGKFELAALDVAVISLLLIWGAYVLEALAFSFSKRYKDRLPLTEYIAVLQLSAAAFLWITCAATGTSPIPRTPLPTIAWLALAFVCCVSCCLCYLLLYWLLRHIDGHKLAFFDGFHTLAAAGLGVALFGESFNLKMLIGGGILLAAAFVITGRPKKSWPSASRSDELGVCKSVNPNPSKSVAPKATVAATSR